MLPRRVWIWIGLALAALLLVAVVMQALNQLIWQLSYWLPGWLIGPLLLLIVAAVVLAVGPIAWPWLRSLVRGGPAKASLPPPSRNRREAAQRNLSAIEQTLEQVRDAVERQALEQERQRMQAELERGDLVITVFGAGSTGKTSLIRSLLGELVGTVGAPMGSTTDTARYRLRLQGLGPGNVLTQPPNGGRIRELTRALLDLGFEKLTFKLTELVRQLIFGQILQLIHLLGSHVRVPLTNQPA